MTDGTKPKENEVETVYVLVASGEYTENINGTPMTAHRVELISAFADKDRAYETLEAGTVDVKEPAKWGVRGISAYPVEVTR